MGKWRVKDRPNEPRHVVDATLVDGVMEIVDWQGAVSYQSPEVFAQFYVEAVDG